MVAGLRLAGPIAPLDGTKSGVLSAQGLVQVPASALSSCSCRAFIDHTSGIPSLGCLEDILDGS